MKMKGKKRDKDVTQAEKVENEQAATDHELFLQAFEKPTQIYRYLRARHLVLPIFLHRCLSYMKKRSSRTNQRRLSFSLDSMLREAELRHKRTVTENYRPDFLNISFSHFCPHEVSGLKGPVQVDVSLLTISPCRRKESSTTCTTDLGVAIVPLDSAPNSASQSKTISVGSDQFSASQVPCAGVTSGVISGGGRSYVLSLRATCQQCKALNGYHQDEPVAKRARLSAPRAPGPAPRPPPPVSGVYSAQLPVYDPHRRCLLTDGEYEISMGEVNGRGARWETLHGEQVSGPFDEFSRQPTLKFRITWSRTAGGASSRACSLSQTAENGTEHTQAVVQEVLHMSKPPSIKTSPSKLKENLLNNNELVNGFTQRVYYQFCYNGSPRQRTESRYDFYCPWCALNCQALYPLLKHLRLSHARFNFNYSPSPVGACIDVTLNETYDGGYVGNPQDTQSCLGYAYCRRGPVQRTPLTHVLVVRPQRPAPSLAEFSEEDESESVRNKQIIQGHNRLYYRTVTNRPIKPSEFDGDSEGENDPEWLRQKTVLMIDEFTDVNPGEKEIMKMWNLHVMKHNYVGDCQLGAACHRFVDEYGPVILSKNLARNMVAHLVNLHDTGLVGADVVLSCSTQLYALDKS